MLLFARIITRARSVPRSLTPPHPPCPLLRSAPRCSPALAQSVAGGYGFDGPYGGYNFGAPSYAPPPGAWPTQPSRQQGYGGAAFMQPSNLYGGAPQHVGGYGGFRGPAQGSMNIPAGAMYNGRPINK